MTTERDSSRLKALHEQLEETRARLEQSVALSAQGSGSALQERLEEATSSNHKALAEVAALQTQGSRALPPPRWSLMWVCLLHVVVLGGGAAGLLALNTTALGALCALLAGLHLITAVFAALRRAHLARVWRALSIASILFALYGGWGLLSSVWQVRAVHASLGLGLVAALCVVYLLILAATLPIAIWGILATGGLRWKRSASVVAAALFVFGGVQLSSLERQVAGAALASPSGSFERELTKVVKGAFKGSVDVARGKIRRSLMNRSPFTCAAPLAEGGLTLFVTLTGRDRKVANHCLQARDEGALLDKLDVLLRQSGRRLPVKFDLVYHGAEVPVGDPLTSSLLLRPGQDGLCHTRRCVMPWQLVAMDAFNSHVPFPSMLPDARFGVDLHALSEKLGASSSEGAYRFSTRGWVLTHRGHMKALSHLHRDEIKFTEGAVRFAAWQAQQYIARAQHHTGLFKYMVHPFTGATTLRPYSIPRQAGTTLATCELAQSERLNETIVNRSLSFLAGLEHQVTRPDGQRVALLDNNAPSERELVGGTALSLAAFLRCRPFTDGRHDPLIGRLARLLLAQQRPDGGFHHGFDGVKGEANPEVPNSLYIDGQIVLSLVLLEAIADRNPEHFPARGEVRAAVERAMDYFGVAYWRHAAGQHFYIEENWHCLAAASALTFHRHDAYERFCLDYVAFKGRFVQGEEAGDPSFRGGWAFAHFVPPHNTATAGFGEALAAAIQIKRARQMPLDEDLSMMREVMVFLLKNQWRQDNCFACNHNAKAPGGFSEHFASPQIRIDYVQHAWAAIAHGARALGHGWTEALPIEVHWASPAQAQEAL